MSGIFLNHDLSLVLNPHNRIKRKITIKLKGKPVHGRSK